MFRSLALIFLGKGSLRQLALPARYGLSLLSLQQGIRAEGTGVRKNSSGKVFRAVGLCQGSNTRSLDRVVRGCCFTLSLSYLSVVQTQGEPPGLLQATKNVKGVRSLWGPQAWVSLLSHLGGTGYH